MQTASELARPEAIDRRWISIDLLLRGKYSSTAYQECARRDRARFSRVKPVIEGVVVVEYRT